MTVPLLAPARVHLTYLWRHRRRLRLASPRLFTEWVQHRKLFDRDPRLPPLADKVAVKALVAAQLGEAWVIPTLWHGNTLPAAPPWPLPVVVKPRAGCGRVAIVTDPADWPDVRRRTARWGGHGYGYWLDEWAYRGAPRGLLVEPYIGCGAVLPVDYKCFVFGGRVEFVQVHLDRAGDHRWIVMDRRWRRVSPPTGERDPARPATLDRIVAAAEALAKGHDFLRADFYEVDGRPLFGELTVYPGSGLLPVLPPALDRRMGEHWRRARERLAAA
ncbi:ATP-grasp fold amidoligase family protein [Sphingomonas sp.]|uniref:ATP-grasp fold amidoligase family protein n=1 Tax=Sphingomonas sp. TaxID=28214 RepID=UPI003CC553C6